MEQYRNYSNSNSSHLSPQRKYGSSNGYYHHQSNQERKPSLGGGGLIAASNFFQGFGISFSTEPQTDNNNNNTSDHHHPSYTSPLSSTPTKKISRSPGSPEDIFQSKVELVLNDPHTFAEFKKRMSSDKMSTNAGVIPLLQDFLEDIQLPELKDTAGKESCNTSSLSLSPLGLFASFYKEDTSSGPASGRDHNDQHIQVPELRSATSHSRSSSMDDISIPSITSSVITGMSGIGIEETL